MNLKQELAKFLKDEEGLTMVEYAVAGTLVTAGAVAAFTSLGTNIAGAVNRLIVAMGGTP